MKRTRLRLRQVIKAGGLQYPTVTRPGNYHLLRGIWLHELRQYRAQRRIAGKNVKKEMKAAQRELAKLREKYPSDRYS